MNNNRVWDVCEVDSSSLSELAELGGIVSGRESEVASVPFLKWQYYDNPAGDVVIWAARDRDCSRLVGSYSVIPLRMKINNRIMTGSLSMNTQTHPDYRKQGIFKVLAEKTFDSCRSRNIPVTIGLPNANSYPGFTGALKFADIGSRNLLIKLFNVGFVIDKLIKNKLINRIVNPFATLGMKMLAVKSSFNRSFDRSIDVIESTSFGPDFDDFWEQISTSHRNMIVRDSSFLDWRFVRCPTRKYRTFKALSGGEMVGYIVASVDKHHSYDCRVAFIVDLMVHPKTDKDSVYKALILEIEKWALADKADFVGIHLSQHLEYYKTLKKIGYLVVPNRFIGGTQAMIVRPHLQECIEDDQLMNFSSWCLMDGDNDRP